MIPRATFTTAELARAIRAAESAGKVAVLTTGGIVFADPDIIQQIKAGVATQADSIDDWFRQHGND